jgi:hypothetical protein
MAVGVLMTLPGLKKEQYEQINERLFGPCPCCSAESQLNFRRQR